MNPFSKTFPGLALASVLLLLALTLVAAVPNQSVPVYTGGDEPPDNLQEICGTFPDNSVSEFDGVIDPGESDFGGGGLPTGEKVGTPEPRPLEPDTDNDGLSDGDEVNIYKTNPTFEDTDWDGLSDGDEVNIYKTNPTFADTDWDGLSDGDEVKTHGTNPMVEDTDRDGLSDGDEVNEYHAFFNREYLLIKTAPTRVDTDADGLSDCAERLIYLTNPLDRDTDGDELTDWYEVKTYSTEPLLVDTDLDGLTDGEEVNTHGTNPLEPDTDGDGLPDGDEVNELTTEPLEPDSDNDGLSDGDEVNLHKTHPNLEDTDHDGLSDKEEVEGPTDPLSPDTDGDGLADGDEVNRYGTSPIKPDTDGDNLSDADEVTCYGTDPNKFATNLEGISDENTVEGTCPTSKPTDGVAETDPSSANTQQPPGSPKVVAEGEPASTTESPDAAGDLKPATNAASGTSSGASDQQVSGASNPDARGPEATQQKSGASGVGEFVDSTRDGGLFGLQGIWKWAFLAVAGIVAFCVGAMVMTLIFRWRSKATVPQDPSAGLQAQQALQSRKEAKATELRNLSAILSRQAQELREQTFLDAVVSNQPSVNGDMSALLDREQIVLSAVQTLEGLTGPSSERRLAMTQLVDSLEREGLKSAALRRAVDGTPATVLHLLLAALQELNEQLGTSLESTPDYMRQVQAARELCNREINDAVARRLPLSLLDVVGEVLQQAKTAPQQRAAHEVADGILAAVYRQYFPRMRRG